MVVMLILSESSVTQPMPVVGVAGGGPAAISIDVALYRENRFNKLEHYVLEQYQASLLH